MVEWCAEIAFRVSKAPIEVIELSREFGRSLGLAFQYTDDCIDFNKNSGKDFSKDLTEGFLNQVTCRLLSAQPALTLYFRAVMDGQVQVDRKSFEREVGAENLSCALNDVKQKASMQVKFAQQALDGLRSHHPRSVGFDHLQKLLNRVVEREA